MIRYAVFAAAFFALATVRDAVTLKDNMSAVFWPETGLLVAVLVLSKRKDWFSFLSLGFLVFLADSTVLKQRPVPLSVIFAASLCFVSTLGASAYLFFVDGKKSPSASAIWRGLPCSASSPLFWPREDQTPSSLRETQHGHG